MALADEVEEPKKKLAEFKQRFLNAKAVAETFKTKLDSESKTADNLRMTISQHVLEKRALTAKFKEAM